MQRARLLIVLGVILLLATILIVAFMFLGQSGSGEEGTVDEVPGTEEDVVAPEPPEIETTEVIVALQPIPRGSEFVQGSIGRRAWPKGNEPPEYIADESETIGKVAKMEISQGQVIVRGMLTDVEGQNEASLQIPRGRVGVAYPFDLQTSVAFAIQQDDFVDILVTSFFLDVDQDFQTVLPNSLSILIPELDPETKQPTGSYTFSDPIDAGRFEIAGGDIPALIYPKDAQVPRRVAQLTVQAAKVIRVGPWLEPTPTPAPAEDVEGEAAQAAAPPPPPPNVATLAVTPQDALVLLWLRQNGIYTEMALRAAGDEDADHLTEAVTLQYMLTRFNISVPPKIEFIMSPSLVELERSSVAPDDENSTQPTNTR